MKGKAFFWILGVSFFIVLVWSAVKPYDYLTWVLEVLPAIAGALILGLTFKIFRLTNLSYLLIWAHAIVLIVGGHYTYVRTPKGTAKGDGVR